MGSRIRRQRRTSTSILEQGWDETHLTWASGMPLGDFLTYVGVGISVREACQLAGLARSTVQGLLETARTWAPADLIPSQIRQIDDDHYRRCVALLAALEGRKLRPKALALTSISSAATSDWRAAEALLRLLYRDEYAQRIETTGAEGGPVEVSPVVVAGKLRQMIENLSAEDTPHVHHEAAGDGPREVAPVRYPTDEIGDESGV